MSVCICNLYEVLNMFYHTINIKLGSLREDRRQTPNFETQRRCLALRMAGRDRERERVTNGPFKGPPKINDPSYLEGK